MALPLKLWAVILISSVPSNPLKPSQKTVMNMRTLIPQGWSFFTKNPREVSPIIFKKYDGQWENISYKNASYRNLFGLSRKSRSLMVSLGNKTGKIPKQDWGEYPIEIKKTYKSSYLDKFDIPNFSVITDKPNKLCGDILVLEKEYIPWAWSRNSENLNMPAKAIILNIECE